MPPLDQNGQDAAPAPQETPAPATGLNALMDAELAEAEAALAAQGLSVDDVLPEPAPGAPIDPAAAPTLDPAATPPAPAAAPTDPAAPPAEAPDPLAQAQQHAQQLAAGLRERDLENARLQGMLQAQAQRPQPSAPAAPAAPPAPTPQQILAEIDRRRSILDKKFDDGEIEAPVYRQHSRQLDRVQQQTIAQEAALRSVAPVARAVASAPPPPDPRADMWLRERTAQLMAAEPWLAKVPVGVLKAFDPEVKALAQSNNLTLDQSPQGIYDYRRCVRAVARAHNMHIAYGDQAAPGATAAAPATPQTPPVPGSQPIPAPRVAQPPNLALHPGTHPAPIGGMSAERIAAMPFQEAATGLSEADMEAIAPSR